MRKTNKSMESGFWGNFQIKHLIIMVISILIISIIITGVVAIVIANKISKNTDTLYNIPHKNLLAVTQMENKISLIDACAKEALIAKDNTTTTEVTAEIQKHSDELIILINDLTERVGENQMINGLKDGYYNWYDSVISVQKAIQSANYDEAERFLDNEYAESAALMSDYIAQLNTEMSANAENYYKDSVELSQSVLIILIAIITITILIGIAAMLIILKIIARPINVVLTATEEFAKGNLSYKITYQPKNEFGIIIKELQQMIHTMNAYVENVSQTLNQLSTGDLTTQVTMEYVGDYAPIKASMEHIITSLNQTLSQINTAAVQVSSGSSQVSGGAQALSQGATEQASAIQELSASITEISQQVKENAENANQANQLFSETNSLIEEGGAEMRRMVDAMNDITDTSEEIQKIINTIDNIAFQTNILALNAAVEAARAGTAGKGFAVVADEVRSLAVKSAEAASNTAELIQTSIKAVEKGSDIAETTSETLGKITESTKRSTKIINKISNASNEQAISIGQITQGVEQISAVVQTNSATAEQSAAASEELSSQAELLKDLVSTFTLTDEETKNTFIITEDTEDYDSADNSDSKY